MQATPALSTNGPAQRFDWRSVEADDYRVYISNLRAVGCPEETIQDIVIADVCKMFESKKRLARLNGPKIDYWKTNPQYMGSLVAEYSVIDRQLTQPLDAERNALLRSLGIEPSPQRLPRPSIDHLRAPLLDFLSDEKRQQIAALNSRLAEETEALAVRRDDPNFQALMLQHEMDADRRLKQILTPDEALQYDLRFSHTADLLRRTLVGFDPSEREFIQLFKLRKSFDDQMRGGEVSIDDEGAAKERLNEQIKATLGEARYEDYDRTDDYGFQQLLAATQKMGLPSSAAIEAFKIRRAAMQKAHELTEAKIDDTVRRTALSDIRAETEKALESALGPDGWKKYNTPFNIEWLERISPREK